ncbi:hypothetical protein F5Y16DRAFT_355945 [Xylariaceae sp. FL0255]|nr:hypothetical protein F5Y16DRAFT_355945 [Xylariaceae sp. FL0255]
MCGRYALALRPSQIRRMLQDDDMPAYDAPEDPVDDDDDDDGGGGGGGGGGGDSGYYDGPRQSYNFAPGYRGVVYRADVPDRAAGPSKSSRRAGKENLSSSQAEETIDEGSLTQESETQSNDDADENNTTNHNDEKTRYKLQAMKWGLIPFWTKRNPDYGSMMKTINCRDDSLGQQSGGMWASMKARKRCVVVAQGFYEWLKKDGSKDKMPHFVKRRDGKLMCMAGLWDMVQYEDDEMKHYTYTIITTDSNKQLDFLHDRMPVILDNGSEKMRTWLDPGRFEWSDELQSLLKPYDGELEVYPVSKDVGKVGNNSPTFIIPIDSKENKSNIANFFAKGAGDLKKKTHKMEEGSKGEDDDGHQAKKIKTEEQPEIEISKDEGFKVPKNEDQDDVKVKNEEHSGTSQPSQEKKTQQPSSTAFSASPSPTKASKTTASSSPIKGGKGTTGAKGGTRQKISATSNGTKAPDKSKSKAAGSQKITKFFGNSS